MKILCQNCHNHFEAPVHNAGSVDFDGCKNVFRVSYRFRTPCPSCKKLLSLAPGKGDETLGIPLNIEQDEATERFEVESEATLPREQVSPETTPLPTIRITKVAPAPISPTIATQIQPFRFINQDVKRPSPLHVAVAPRRKGFVPLFKFMFGFLIASASTAAVLLTMLALHSPSQPKVAQEAPPPTHYSQANIQKRALPKEPQGGPSELFTSRNPSPSIVIKSVAPFLKEERLLDLPELDRLTSGYGVRLDPFTKKLAFHAGIDFAMAYRAEVKAALPAKVKRAGRLGSYGNVVILKHADGYETRYAHLDKILVHEGDEVQQGELIGLAGSTGRSTGTHLHFELLKDGKRVDPLRTKLISKKS